MQEQAFCKCTKSMKKKRKKRLKSPDSLVYEEHSHVAHKFPRFSRQKMTSFSEFP